VLIPGAKNSDNLPESSTLSNTLKFQALTTSQRNDQERGVHQVQAGSRSGQLSRKPQSS
jgi:hypothetical protein